MIWWVIIEDTKCICSHDYRKTLPTRLIDRNQRTTTFKKLVSCLLQWQSEEVFKTGTDWFPIYYEKLPEADIDCNTNYVEGKIYYQSMEKKNCNDRATICLFVVGNRLLVACNHLHAHQDSSSMDRWRRACFSNLWGSGFWPTEDFSLLGLIRVLLLSALVCCLLYIPFPM